MNLRSVGLRFLRRKKARTPGPAHPDGAGAAAPQDGGKLYALWLTILPLLLGATLGWFASVCLGAFLDSLGGAGVSTGPVAGVAAEQESVGRAGMGGFLAANPFRISPMLAPEVPVGEASNDVVITGSLATAVLRGTLPDVGVWLEDKGRVSLVLVGTSFDVYTLRSVTYREAVFEKGEERVVRELLYSAPGAGKTVAASRSNNNPAPNNVPPGEVEQATEEKEGVIPVRLAQDLLQNPFDELKRVRLRPLDNEPGLQIQWIQNDSILKRLGVQKGDVIKAVNGIPFSNMGDIANSINSLMDSERFDVEVTRKGKPTALRYVVR